MAERVITPTTSELLSAQTDAIDRFRGREVFPEPPKALLEFIERTTEQGFTFEPYLEPNITFSQDVQYPGLQVRPNQYFYDLIKEGLLPSDAMRLSGPVWAAMEAIQKQNYDGGRQLYENDPLAPILEDLRQRGKIKIPDWCRHIPATSRFGVSALELEHYIYPLFAQQAGVSEEQVGNSYAAFLYRGNTAHPEWGKTSTAEWFTKNKLRGGGSRLIGGSSDHGGLGDVDVWGADDHDDGVGFRLRVVFPSSKS